MKLTFSLLLLVLLFAQFASAQELKVGDEYPGTLTPDTTHTYTFQSYDGFYVYGFANQISVDVVVKVLDPDGEQIAEFDSPARGPEPFQITPEKDGEYTITIEPFEGAEGDYIIRLVANEKKETDPEKLVDQMMTPFSSDDVPGATISVVKNGKLIFSKGYGMSNLTYGVKMTDETGMSIASVSKQFTAMAILLLQNQGKLSLDDDVRKHIPELQDFGTPITLLNMLNHTTGYREVLNFLPMAGWQFTDDMRRDELISIIQRQANLQNAPGSEYNYNNTTFMLLATVVERVSGQGWQEFMEENIFEPLGMDDTTVKTHQGQVIPNSSQGYAAAEEGGYRGVTDFASAYGASGVNSTAIDMTKWMLNYRDAKVGGAEAIELLTSRGILTNGDTTRYALGLGVREWRGQTLYTHNGGETSHRTYFGYFPEIESGLFFSSSNPSFSLGVWTDFAEAFFGEYLEREEEEEEGDAEEADSISAKPTPEQLDAIAGTYKFVGATLMIEYTVEDGTLFAQATSQPRFAVTPTSDSTFTFVGVTASVTFRYEEDGTVQSGTHHQGGDTPLEKIEVEAMTEEQLTEFVGRYYNAELETVYTLRIEEGKLMANHRKNEPFSLTHQENDDFTSAAWYMGQINFDRNPAGQIDGFMASNSRTRNVWFEKLD
ncbi:MAG: serine hydrolase [Bacteroidetes bacterium]|nr:MAG: serine hydrolase [Bacteroidota bacterium]